MNKKKYLDNFFITMNKYNIKGDTIKTPRDKYLNDPYYNSLVNTLVKYLQ